MTYVVAGYVLVFGSLGLYAGTLVLRSRRAAAALLERVPRAAAEHDASI